MLGVSCALTVAILAFHPSAIHHNMGHGGHDSDSTPYTLPVVPVDNMAYYLTQGNECLDVYESSELLSTYDCWGYYQANQEFVWRRDQGMLSNLIFTPALGGRCVTIEGPSGQRPADLAPALLVACDPNNTNAQWTYNFESKTMNLLQFPDLCLDLQVPWMYMFGLFNSAWVSHFAISPCENSMLNLLGPDTKAHQIINVEPFNYIYDTTPRGPLVAQAVDRATNLLTHGDYCLDFHQDGDQVLLYTCNQQVNQEFQWRAAGNDTFQIFMPVQAGLCLSIGDQPANFGACAATGCPAQRPQMDTKLTFRACVAAPGDPLQMWRYSNLRLRSAVWTDLCATEVDTGHFSLSSDFFAVNVCIENDPLNPSPVDTQTINIEPLPSQYAPFPPALAGAFALPAALGLGGRGLGAVAAAAACAVAALAGLVVAARRRSRMARGGDDLLEGQWLE